MVFLFQIRKTLFTLTWDLFEVDHGAQDALDKNALEKYFDYFYYYWGKSVIIYKILISWMLIKNLLRQDKIDVQLTIIHAIPIMKLSCILYSLVIYKSVFSGGCQRKWGSSFYSNMDKIFEKQTGALDSCAL